VARYMINRAVDFCAGVAGVVFWALLDPVLRMRAVWERWQTIVSPPAHGRHFFLGLAAATFWLLRPHRVAFCYGLAAVGGLLALTWYMLSR
jgi:hypothetical protein